MKQGQFNIATCMFPDTTARDVMIDLETIDNIATSAIASIGACVFDKDGTYDQFYIVVDTKSCLDIGMTYSEATLAFWAKQDPRARVIFDEATPKVSIQMALTMFSEWFKKATAKEIWGNGADFDNAIMAYAYRMCGMKQPWSYGDSRCFRTIKNGAYMENRVGTYHNALDDAITQAQYMIDNELMPPR